MLEVVGALVVLVLMVGIFMLMIPGLRPNGRKAHSVSFLHQYGEGSGWGVALMAGFAVYDMLRAVVTVSGAPQGMGLATMGFALCAAVGLSCTVTRGNGGVWQLPASLVGAVAAAWKTIVVAQESWARAEWTTVALVGAMAMVFGFTTVVRLLVGGLAGLAWYTALEVMLFLASPFGVELREMTGWSQGVMAFLMVAIPLSLAILPFVVLNSFAIGIVLAEVGIGMMGLGEVRLEAWLFAGIAWGVYWAVTGLRRKVGL